MHRNPAGHGQFLCRERATGALGMGQGGFRGLAARCRLSEDVYTGGGLRSVKVARWCQ